MKLKISFLICILIMLGGCRIDIKSDLYSQDVFSSENITFPAQLKFEIGSCTSNKRSEYEASVLVLFSKLSKAEVVGCKQEGMDSLVTVNFLGEMATEKSKYDLVVFRTVESPNKARLQMKLNSNFIDKARSMMRENMQELKSNNLRFTVNVNNDDSKPIEILVFNAWVNGQATEGIKLKLNRREKAIIDTSNIFSDLILMNQQPRILIMNR